MSGESRVWPRQGSVICNSHPNQWPKVHVPQDIGLQALELPQCGTLFCGNAVVSPIGVAAQAQKPYIEWSVGRSYSDGGETR